MKIGIIIYYNNPLETLKASWIYDSLKSIQKQTEMDYEIFELDYSGKTKSIIKTMNFFEKRKCHFHSVYLPSEMEALNFIISETFEKKCDVLFNVNLKDVYSPLRFETQLKSIEEGFDVVFSNKSNFQVYENQKTKEKVQISKYTDNYEMHKTYIKQQLRKNKDFLPYSVMCLSRECWVKNSPITQNLDEFMKRVLKNKGKIIITDDYLLYSRII